MAIVDGGVPHNGPDVPAGKMRAVIFMTAAPLRTAHPYSGYVQIIGGEVELFWAAMAKTEEDAKRLFGAWQTAFGYWAAHYVECELEETDGPVVKVLKALTVCAARGELPDPARALAMCRNAVAHLSNALLHELGLQSVKWDGSWRVYGGLVNALEEYTHKKSKRPRLVQ